MSTGTDPKRKGSPEVQTFGLPKPPPPPPEDPKDKTPPKATANHWVILIFLGILGGLLGFYYLIWHPKVQRENAEATAAAAYVRPWAERAEESVRTTLEGQAGVDFAASIQLLLDPEGSNAKLQSIDTSAVQETLVTVFRISWNQAAPEGQDDPQLTLSTASLEWTSADKKHLGVELLVPEGTTPPTEEQDAGIKKIFSTQVHPLVRRNTAEK